MKYIYSVDQARGQDGWMLAKRERGQYPAPLDRICFVNKGLYGTEKNDLRTCLFSSTEKEASSNAKVMARFRFFFGFSVPYRQRNHRKSRIIFYERKLSCSGLDFGEMLLREQNGHSRAGFIPPSCPLGLPIKVQALVLLARSRAELAI